MPLAPSCERVVDRTRASSRARQRECTYEPPRGRTIIVHGDRHGGASPRERVHVAASFRPRRDCTHSSSRPAPASAATRDDSRESTHASTSTPGSAAHVAGRFSSVGFWLYCCDCPFGMLIHFHSPVASDARQQHDLPDVHRDVRDRSATAPRAPSSRGRAIVTVLSRSSSVNPLSVDSSTDQPRFQASSTSRRVRRPSANSSVAIAPRLLAVAREKVGEARRRDCRRRGARAWRSNCRRGASTAIERVVGHLRHRLLADLRDIARTRR